MLRNSLAALVISAFAVPAAAHASQVEIVRHGPVIELSVFESIAAEPDIVTIGAGVSTEARTAVEAMRLNSVEMQKVIDKILGLGVEEKDIQTTGINLNARYDYDRENQRNVFRGYEVSNRVSVILRDIDETGAVLDALVLAGATDLNGPTFSIEDDKAAKEIARTRAVERAEQRALSYAALYGFNAVKILSVSEDIRGRGPMPEMAMRAVASDSVPAAPPPPVQPGQVNTGVSITIRYEMVDEGGASQ